MKRHAIMSLGMIGDARALPAVMDALKGRGSSGGHADAGCIVSEDPFIKEAAATALAHFRDPRVIPDLIMGSRTKSPGAGGSRRWVLIGDTAIEPLVAFLHDPKGSEVESKGERVMSFATSRLTAVDALRQITVETLKKARLGTAGQDETRRWTAPGRTPPLNLPLGDNGRFGPWATWPWRHEGRGGCEKSP